MKRFRVKVMVATTGYVEIEAEDAAQARDRAMNRYWRVSALNDREICDDVLEITEVES